MKKENNPILSIITINRNNAKGLERTIESVISQTFRDFEWIVIDGASTDESVDVIKKYAEHFTYWISEKDTGVYNAMNKGIRQAKGKYLQFLNSGDWLYANDVYEKVFSEQRDKDIFWGLTVTFDANGGQHLFGQQTTEFSAFESIGNIPHPSSFIKRDLFDKFGLYDESYRVSADAKFFFHAIVMQESSIECISMPLVYFEGGGLSEETQGTAGAERIIETYLPKRLVGDFKNYLFYETYINENGPKVQELKTLKQHNWSRFIIRCLNKILRTIY